jgi:hypothetical protein
MFTEIKKLMCVALTPALDRKVPLLPNARSISLSFFFKRVFGSVVVVAFQIAFRAEIHANDVFSFFKNHF